MRKSLEIEIKDWELRMTLAQRGLTRHEHDSTRALYETEFLDLLEEGGKYAQHVWKPYVQWYARYQHW